MTDDTDPHDAAPTIDLPPERFAELLQRTPELVERAAARALRELPSYASVSFADVRDGIAADLGRGAAALMEGRELTEQDREAMGAIGDRRAGQGIPLEDVLRVYRITIDELFAELRRLADEGIFSGDEVLRLTHHIWRRAETSMQLAGRAYRDRELHEAVRDTHGRAAVVRQVLIGDGRPGLPTGGIVDPGTTYLAFRARWGGDPGRLLQQLSVPGVLERGAAALHEGDVIGLAGGIHLPGELAAVVVGVGPLVPVDELRRSFEEAARVLQAGDAFGRSGVLSLGDVALEVVAMQEASVCDGMVAELISPCRPQSAAGEALVDTLAALIANGMRVERTADLLYVHPNTVRNRIHRFEELTGRSLGDVDTLVQLRLALLRRELVGDGAVAAAS